MTDMWRTTARIAILFGILVPLPGCDAVLALFDPPPAPGPEFVLLLPDGNVGWTCVDFGVENAPPLARDGEAWVVDATSHPIVSTSSHPAGLLTLFPRDAYLLINGERTSLPPGVEMRRASSNMDTNSPIARHCVFYGTELSAQKAGDAPELVRPHDSCCTAKPSESPKE